MSTEHRGNTQPSISQEEHEASVNPPTKRVLPYGWDGSAKNLFFVDTNGIARSIVSIAHPISTTLSGNMTLNPSPNYIGLVTVANTVPVTGTFWQTTQPVSFAANVTLNPSSAFIGLTTVVHGSNVTLNASNAYIGLVTVANTVPVTGTFWQSTQPVSFTGNVTLNPSSSFIGSVTAYEAVSTSIAHGMVSAASGSLVQFAQNACRWVTVRAHSANATTIYVGGSLATINNALPLDPGDSQGLALNNTNLLYLVGVGSPCEIRYLAGN